MTHYIKREKDIYIVKERGSDLTLYESVDRQVASNALKLLSMGYGFAGKTPPFFTYRYAPVGS